MKIQRKREIVIEFERTQMVRKKARTHIIFCRKCGREVDFVELCEAAALLMTPVESLLNFIRVSNSHFESLPDGGIYICLISFLAALKAKTNFSRIKLIGD